MGLNQEGTIELEPRGSEGGGEKAPEANSLVIVILSYPPRKTGWRVYADRENLLVVGNLSQRMQIGWRSNVLGGQDTPRSD